jgi:hypothetical protein
VNARKQAFMNHWYLSRNLPLKSSSSGNCRLSQFRCLTKGASSHILASAAEEEQALIGLSSCCGLFDRPDGRLLLAVVVNVAEGPGAQSFTNVRFPAADNGTRRCRLGASYPQVASAHASIV